MDAVINAYVLQCNAVVYDNVIMTMLTVPHSVYIACLQFCTLCTLLTDLLSRSDCPSSQCSREKKQRDK